MKRVRSVGITGLVLAAVCAGGSAARTHDWPNLHHHIAPAPSQAPAAAQTPPRTALDDYNETVRNGDSLYAEGSYRDAVLAYEHAWRIAYNNKLKTDAAALDERLARARKARDEKPAAAPGRAPSPAAAGAQGPPPKILEEYEAAVREGDALSKVGNYFDAVLAYERAGRIAYGNGAIDASALAERLAKARKARDTGEEGEVVRFLDLTVPQAASVRVVTASHYDGHEGAFAAFDGMTDDDRWLVANPYLPGGHRFFDMIYGAACTPDGSLYVAADGVVPAEATRRRPRSNRDWYADNGHGLWRVAPDGRVAPFAVGAYGTYPPPGLLATPKALCDVGIAEVARVGPSQWGGIAVGSNGDAYVSDTEHHMILKLRGGGTVEHVAGGGERACTYDRWKDETESGYRDGPGTQALFRYPQGLAIDREGNLLVADYGNCALRRVTPSGEVTTIQRGCFASPADKGDQRKRINHIFVVVDPEGRPVVGGSFVVPHVNIYSNVHRLHADGRVEQLLSARKGYANTGELRVEYLSGLAYLPDGRLLIADYPNNLLRTVDGTRLTDWLGAVENARTTDIDGRPPKARVRRPGGLCVTGDGVLFIMPASRRSGPVRKVDSKTREVSTWVY